MVCAALPTPRGHRCAIVRIGRLVHRPQRVAAEHIQAPQDAARKAQLDTVGADKTRANSQGPSDDTLQSANEVAVSSLRIGRNDRLQDCDRD